MIHVAALLTSHDRRETTLRCLDRLAAQEGHRADVRVYLVDAGSADGTPGAVAERFPDATVIERTADLFWNAGMRVAFRHAVDDGHDHYLWLNDDTLLDQDALARLLETADELADPAVPTIVAGATRDPDGGSVTYGGVRRVKPSRPLKFELVPVSDRPQHAETMNGNVVLVPHEVVERIGVLDSAFTHGMGDYDYGLRAGAAGCQVWVAPGTVGTCARNPPAGSPVSLRKHVQRLTGPKGLPVREWTRFARRWAGPLWPVYALSPYVRRTVHVLRGAHG